MPRLFKISPAQYGKLSADDDCYYIGEYTARGGYQASDINSLISNLKKKPPVPQNQVRYKELAIRECGDKLAAHLNLDDVAPRITFVPAPCSKPLGHPQYDDRILRVLQRIAAHRPTASWDVRPILISPRERPAQHEGVRLSVPELRESMAIDPTQHRTPIRNTVIAVDDVFTQGGTFKAMQSWLEDLDGVTKVYGLFVAKTVWPPDDDMSDLAF